MTTFTLTITLGNEAMQEANDIAWTLRKVAFELENDPDHNRIRDINGNTVGEWEIKHETPSGFTRLHRGLRRVRLRRPRRLDARNQGRGRTMKRWWIHFDNFSIGPFERREDAHHHWASFSRALVDSRRTITHTGIGSRYPTALGSWGSWC